IFLAAGSWNEVIPLLPDFLGELVVRRSLAFWSGLVFAAQSFAAIFMQPFWGRLGDRVGRKPMVLRAGFCLAAIYFLMSVCRRPWELALLRFLNGALTGFIPGSYALIATNTPEDLAGRYVATAQSASAIGGLAGPVIGTSLASLMGLRWSLRLSAAVVFGATLLVLVFVREEQRPVPQPEAGYLADLYPAAKHPCMPPVLLVAFLGAAVNPAIQPILPLHLVGLRGTLTPWLRGAIYSLPGLAFVLTALIWTRLGEKRTRLRVMYWGLVGTSISLLILASAGSLRFFVLFYFLLGIFLASLGPNAAAHMAEEIPPDLRGRSYGLWQAANTFGSFVGPLLAGALGSFLDLSWVFASMGLLTAVGAGILTLSFRGKKRPSARFNA
ncbi:MAG: multidrug efflux MFS transporter, partial [Firmicutes bacterium]|nr:multidrug efflux MFS transporter [Bacillota bacterium]